MPVDIWHVGQEVLCGCSHAAADGAWDGGWTSSRCALLALCGGAQQVCISSGVLCRAPPPRRAAPLFPDPSTGILRLHLHPTCSQHGHHLVTSSYQLCLRATYLNACDVNGRSILQRQIGACQRWCSSITPSIPLKMHLPLGNSHLRHLALQPW